MTVINRGVTTAKKIRAQDGRDSASKRTRVSPKRQSSLAESEFVKQFKKETAVISLAHGRQSQRAGKRLNPGLQLLPDVDPALLYLQAVPPVRPAGGANLWQWLLYLYEVRPLRERREAAQP